jgi:CRISPR system Cascade subunit CasE
VIQFTTLDFHGVLRIANPEQFLHTLFTGIGRAKGFGSGLLLIKPIS